MVGTERLKACLARGEANPEVWIRFPRQLGDVIFSLPFLGSLQRAWNAAAEETGHTLRWVAVGHAIGAAVFSEADPAFIAESLIETGGQGKPDPWMLLRRWRSSRPVAVINLSQSVRLVLGAWMARVPIRAGIADNHLALLYTHPFHYRDLPIHIVDRYRPLLAKLTGGDDLRWLPLCPALLGGASGLDLLRQAGWDGRPFVTLAFGTRGDEKRWFPERENWPALARIFLEQGLAVVWVGSPDERPLGSELALRAPGSFNLTGQTTIPQVCAIQHAAYGTVAVDTGLAHTSAGAGRPTLTLINRSLEHLIHPQGPYSVALRGAAMRISGPEPEANPQGGAAHRITPERAANLLHALAAEAAGVRITPVAATRS
jgi:ADP-heptose:LPS heptosyltransferase